MKPILDGLAIYAEKMSKKHPSQQCHLCNSPQQQQQQQQQQDQDQQQKQQQLQVSNKKGEEGLMLEDSLYCADTNCLTNATNYPISSSSSSAFTASKSPDFWLPPIPSSSSSSPMKQSMPLSTLPEVRSQKQLNLNKRQALATSNNNTKYEVDDPMAPLAICDIEDMARESQETCVITTVVSSVTNLVSAPSQQQQQQPKQVTCAS